MPASTPWWSTPSATAPRPGRRPTLGLAAAIVASVLSGAAMADPHPLKTHRGVSTAAYSTPAASYGIERGTCDRNRIARVLVPGIPLVPATLGRSMDAVDQSCVGRILEYAPDRTAVRWYGAPRINYGGPAFAVTPLRTFERDGQFCRDFQAVGTVDGQTDQVYGTACRMPDGLWRIQG
jgi:surface antigen